MKSSSDPAEVLIVQLIGQGIRIRSEGGRLTLAAGSVEIEPELLDRVRGLRDRISAIVGERTIACLTPAQQRFWFLEQFGSADAYHLPGLARIDGPLDRQGLKAAFEALIRRHESLRTRIRTVGGVPVAAVEPVGEVPFEVLESPDEASAMAVARSIYTHPFVLDCDPPCQAFVLAWSPHEVLLLLHMHHIVTDGWSMQVILKDLRTAYERAIAGKSASLPPLALQYSGYASWKRATVGERSTVEAREKSLMYFENALADLEDLKLPSDRPRPEVLSGNGAVFARPIDAMVNGKIHEAARRLKITPFSIWLGAIHLTLARRGGGASFSIGVPVSGRGEDDLAEIVGLFVNTLIVKPGVDPVRMTAGRYFESVHASLTGAMEHRDLPVDAIIERLRPRRRLDSTPLFQVLANYASEAPQAAEFGNCLLTPLLPESRTAKFEWTFSITERGEAGPLLAIEYSTDLHSEETVEAIAGELARYVEKLTEDTERRVSDIDGLDESTIDRLAQWCTGGAAKAVGETVLEAIEARVRSQPEAIAIEDSGISWTYAEVDVAATSVAKRLRAEGVEYAAIVAIALPRSARFVIAALGVLKAGAAYVPIEVNEAETRVLRILQDSGARFLLGDDSALPGSTAMAVAAGVRFVPGGDWPAEPDGIGSGSKLWTGSPEPVRPGPGDLAYVHFTSGTTGRPKGAMVEHRSVVNHSEAVIVEFGLSANDLVAQLSTPAFDIFVEEVFPTLRCGATLVVVDDESRRDPRLLARETRIRRITVLDLPTASFHSLAEDDEAVGSLSDSVRLVIVGGERLNPKAAADFARRRPSIRLVNTYGPTECTVICTTHTFDPNTDADDVPIGRPIAGVELRVIDEFGRPAPIGVPGELQVGGACLMRGYAGRPEETAQSLVMDPLDPGRKFYRTGDLVRWTQTGTLRYVGRRDDQMKIRGFRVEPAEVESALIDLERVAQAKVIAIGPPESRRLAAFVVAKPGHHVSTDALREELARRLPEYMRPAVVRVLESMPVKGGKIDSRELAALAEARQRELGSAEGKPEDRSVIAKVTEIWRETLQSDAIGPDEDFFEAGGHSLLAVRMIRRLEAEFGISLPVAEAFRNPTVSGLSRRISEISGVTAEHPPKSGARILKRSIPTFLLPGLPGIGEHYFELADALPTEGEVYALSLPGYEGDEPARTISQMARHWRNVVNAAAAGRQVRFVAHSYSGSVLHEMLRVANECRFGVESIVLVDSMPHDRLSKVGGDLLETWRSAYGIDRIAGASEVVAAALSVPHVTEPVKIDSEAILVIGDRSAEWLDPGCWNAYFASVRTIRTPGDHLSLVRSPDCEHWLERLFPDLRR